MLSAYEFGDMKCSMNIMITDQRYHKVFLKYMLMMLYIIPYSVKRMLSLVLQSLEVNQVTDMIEKDEKIMIKFIICL